MAKACGTRPLHERLWNAFEAMEAAVAKVKADQERLKRTLLEYRKVRDEVE